MNRRHTSLFSRAGRPSSFTLVEMLTVIAIIAILIGLTLSAFSGLMNQSARSRARAEVAAISSQLESYKSDNGAYPQASFFSSTNTYNTAPTTANGLYQQSAQILYQSLTGLTNYADAPQVGVKTYMTFRKSQLGNDAAGSGSGIYVKDPFGNAYGYWTGNGANLPVNGTNLFDIWSTGGDPAGTNAPGWISNWNN